MTKLPKNWHDLKPYAVGFFRAQAGYIAPKMPIAYDWIDELEIEVECATSWRGMSFQYVKWYGVAIRFVGVCWDCVYEIKKVMPHLNSFTVHIKAGCLNSQKCTICGREGWDSIPF